MKCDMKKKYLLGEQSKKKTQRQSRKGATKRELSRKKRGPTIVEIGKRRKS